MLGTLPGHGAKTLISHSPSSQATYITVHVYVYGGSSGWGQVYVLVISDSNKESEKDTEQAEGGWGKGNIWLDDQEMPPWNVTPTRRGRMWKPIKGLQIFKSEVMRG